MSVTLLALDLGTKTGFACGKAGEIISGTKDFKPTRFESEGMRYIKFRSFLTQMHEATGFQLIVFESVRAHAGVQAAHVYGGMLAALKMWCEDHLIEYCGLAVQDIKKAATGKGNASKNAVIEAMRGLGHDPVDDNEADALAIYHCHAGTIH